MHEEQERAKGRKEILTWQPKKRSSFEWGLEAARKTHSSQVTQSEWGAKWTAEKVGFEMSKNYIAMEQKLQEGARGQGLEAVDSEYE